MDHAFAFAVSCNHEDGKARAESVQMENLSSGKIYLALNRNHLTKIADNYLQTFQNYF